MCQKTFVGRGSSEKLKEIVQGFSPNRVLLVRGKKSFIECGASHVISSALDGTTVIEYFDFQDNPKIEDVYKGLQLMGNDNVDIIVGVGGGSVLDMAKLIRFLYSYDTNEVFSSHVFRRKKKPLILLPTTAGTGAEATHFSVIYSNNRKYSLEHDDVMSDIAIVDSCFTYNTPKYITACAGIDALSQAVESFWNVNANEESDLYSSKAIGLLHENLAIAVNNPTKESRDKVSEGAYWAGRAINITKTTAPHAFSYPFTTYYGIPHGHAVSFTLPKFMEINWGMYQSKLNIGLEIGSHHRKMCRLYDMLGIDNYMTAYNQMRQFIVNDLHLNPMSEFDKKLIMDNVNVQRLNNNPIKICESDIEEIVKCVGN